MNYKPQHMDQQRRSAASVWRQTGDVIKCFPESCSLDPSLLVKLRSAFDGGFQAQCPACAAEGGDQKGEHLRIFKDGRYGCALEQGESGHKHRQEIHRLAGKRTGRQHGAKVVPGKVVRFENWRTRIARKSDEESH